MVRHYSGQQGSLPVGCVAIVVSRYNDSITFKLRDGAIETLRKAGVDEAAITVVEVPGAWELPLLTADLAADANVIAVIALGAVIRGETTHDEHINRAVSLTLMDLGVQHRKPIAFGLLTCNTVEQAIHRSGGNVGNKGIESADAVLELLRLRKQLHG